MLETKGLYILLCSQIVFTGGERVYLGCYNFGKKAEVSLTGQFLDFSRQKKGEIAPSYASY